MKTLITGGVGFVGTNLAKYLLDRAFEVVVVDDISRPGGGAEKNLEYLRTLNKKNFNFIKSSITDFENIKEVCKDVDIIYHLAAQTAMTTSIEDPLNDFKINAGSFNILEATRQVNDKAILIYTSTNKVYGNLANLPLKELATRWEFSDFRYQEGIDEAYPVSPEGPYGCSKYIGDCYFLDYAHTYGMNTIVFRCSAMYGGLQRALEDQGWIGWFLKCAALGQPVKIYGDGKQLRDVLYIDDVTSAFQLAIENIKKTKGQVYNIGGGRKNSISILELIDFIKSSFGKQLKYSFDKWRRADQKIYISNINKAKKDFGWEPKVSKEEGIKRQYEWILKSER